MYRKVLSCLALLLILSTFVFAQDTEDEGDWYYGHDISKIEFEGLKNVKKTDLTGLISAYEDSVFSDEVYNELLDRLYAIDLFEDISPYAKHDPKNNDKVLLVFQVVERPVIKEITFEGNRKIRNGELRDKIKIKKSDVFVESKVLIEERVIRNHYIEKGYINSTVSHKIETFEDGVHVKFIINEGANTVIKAIKFSGNTIVSEKILKSKLELKEAGFLRDGAYQVATLEQDKLAVKNYYTERGYVDVNILDVKIDTEYNEDKQRNELTITYYIQEGAQYIFTGFNIEGNEVFDTDKLLALNKMKVNAVFNETKFQETLSSISDIYYQNGYMNAVFYPIPTKDYERHEISYKLTIIENTRSHIENIIIKGNSKTKEFVIRREIPIKPGDVFSRDKIYNGMRNLMNLQYFSNIIPEPQQGSEPGLVDLVWTVEEQSTAQFLVNATFSGTPNTNEMPISLGLEFANTNFLGEGKDISAKTNVSPYEQSLSFSYGQSWIGNLPIAFQEQLSISKTTTSARINQFLPNLSFNQQYYYMNYSNYSFSLSSNFARRWTPDFAVLSLAGGLTNSLNNNVYDQTSYVPIDINIASYANRWGITNSIYSRFSVDHRDINYDPSQGWFASQGLYWYGLLPSLEKEFFLKTETKLEGYFKLFDFQITEKYNLKAVLAGFSTFTGLIPVNSVITESNRLYIDGMFNGRGWIELYRSNKGQAMWSNSLEFRIPVFPNILGVDLFWDAVVVKDTINDMSSIKLDDFYFSFGPGLRFLIPQFPLRFLFAFRYKTEDCKFKWDQMPFNFVLSFNIPNR